MAVTDNVFTGSPYVLGTTTTFPGTWSPSTTTGTDTSKLYTTITTPMTTTASHVTTIPPRRAQRALIEAVVRDLVWRKYPGADLE